MALLFGTKAAAADDKAIPHGGLGGCVVPRSPGGGMAAMEKLPSVPKRRFRGPPLRIPRDNIIPAALTAVSCLNLSGVWTPITPIDHGKHHSFSSENLQLVTSRYATASPAYQPVSPLNTPVSTKQSSLAELPGSLLLPAQGFAQTQTNPTSTSLALLQRRDTDESLGSEALSLIYSTPDEEETMDTLRHLTASRKHDRARADMKYTIGNGGPSISALQILKPFASMTVEELLDSLAGCDQFTIVSQWLPALRVQIGQMTSLLTQAAEMQVDASVDQVTMNLVSPPPRRSDLVTDDSRLSQTSPTKSALSPMTIIKLCGLPNHSQNAT
jgi:hypothetical protein